MNIKKILLVLTIGLALYGYFEKPSGFIKSGTQENAVSNEQIASAFQNRQSDIQVGGSGVVIRNLPDDTQGNRHHKFILQLSSGQTLLISHNIDLAPRIDTLQEGDTVDFYGQYEWNPKGGVVHWTHHDPDGKHGGWLIHEGTTYQ